MKKYIFLSVALLTFTVSCNNSDDNNIIDKQPQGLQFNFTEADYGEEEVLSRAETVQTETVDFGDCEAEVSVENESVGKVLQTETRIISNKHYTIRAYQGGVRKGEIKGTFNGATFTPDAGSPKDIYVEPGSCDFVAFNDDVTPVGENLTVDESKMQTARIASFTTTIAAQKQQQVNFEMKHVCARLRTQLVCQKHMPENITATLEETTPNAVPASVSYNPVTKAYTAVTTKSMTPQNSSSPASTEAPYTASNGGQTFAYTSTSNYHYFLPATEGSKLKLTFNAGTIFWKPMSGSIPKLNATLIMQPNKSYVVKIKLKPKFTYLFNDGTTGFLSETKAPGSTKKVIGIVVGQGRAVGAFQGWAYNWDNQAHAHTGVMYAAFTTTSSSFYTNISDMNGYEYCWTTTYNTNHPDHGTAIRAYISDFQQISEATRYNPPGVPKTPWMQTHKWYLPAYGEYKLIFDNLGFGDYTKLKNNNAPAHLNFDYQAPWYGYIAQSAFTQVPSGRFALNQYYASSSETDREHFAEPFPSETVFRWAGSGVKNFQYYYTYLNVSFIKY